MRLNLSVIRRYAVRPPLGLPFLIYETVRPKPQTLTYHLYSDLNLIQVYMHVLCLLNSVALQKLSGVHVYTHVLYWVRTVLL